MSKKAASTVKAAAAPAPVAVPLRGSLYAQLLCSDDRRLKLRCSQKLWLNPNTAVKLFAMFTDGEAPRVRTQVKHKLFLDALPALRVSGRLRHEDKKVKATLYLKHRQSLGAHTALNAKVELHARGQIGGPLSEVEKRVEGRLELSQKLLNLTDSQDCRLRLGYDARARSVYAEARENHLSVKLARASDGRLSYSVLYDL